MSYREYSESVKISTGDEIGDEPSFYSIIMAAMRRADTSNLAKLCIAFPKQWEELKARYGAPGGCLSKEEAVAFLGYGKDRDDVEFPMEGWPYGA